MSGARLSRPASVERACQTETETETEPLVCTCPAPPPPRCCVCCHYVRAAARTARSPRSRRAQFNPRAVRESADGCDSRQPRVGGGHSEWSPPPAGQPPAASAGPAAVEMALLGLVLGRWRRHVRDRTADQVTARRRTIDAGLGKTEPVSRPENNRITVIRLIPAHSWIIAKHITICVSVTGSVSRAWTVAHANCSPISTCPSCITLESGRAILTTKYKCSHVNEGGAIVRAYVDS